MLRSLYLVTLVTCLLFVGGCATVPKEEYIAEAQEISDLALEPVTIDGALLKKDLEKIKNKIPVDRLEAIVNLVTEQISKTKRFEVVRESITTGKSYLLQPRIEDIPEVSIIKIPVDPTRVKMIFRARVRIEVSSFDVGGQKKHRSFSDSREFEIKIPVSNKPDTATLQEYYYEPVEVGFKAAANLLGAAFNPSYERGTVTKINGKTAYVKINTTKLSKMPKMKRKLQVMDSKDRNKVIAEIDSLTIENGTASGVIFLRAGESVTEGSLVRVQVNDLEK